MRLILIALIGLAPNIAMAGKYTCENDEVVEAVKTELVCSRMFTPCSYYGLPNDYALIQSLDDKTINDRFDRDYADVVLSKEPANERRALEEFNVLARAAALSVRGLLSSAESLAIDHNPSIDRYICQLSITYAPVNLKVFALTSQAQLLLKMPEVRVMIQRPNGHKEYMQLLGRMILTSNLEQKVEAYGVRKALFSVQPSAKTRFTIDILKFEAPVTFFEN